MFKLGRFRAKRDTEAISDGKSSGAGCLIPFGLVFGGMGLLFTIFMAREVIEDGKTRGWAEVPAELLRCEIRVNDADKDSPFLLEVEYRYHFEGQTHTSTRYSRKEKWTDDYEELALQRAAFYEGDGSAPCYVNPENPTEAIMVRGSPWGALLVLFPLVFVLIGGAIVWGGVASLRKKKKVAAETSPKALSSSAKKRSEKAGPIALGIFGLVFFAVGFGVLFPLAITPYRKSKAAQAWVETPCEIIWSRVRSHKGDDSTTYSVDIFFQYEFAGATHRSNRYSFATGSSSGSSGKSAIVKQYPRSSRQTCYVDPAQPERAVLERSISSIGFWFLIPAAFMVFGLLATFGALSALLKGKKSAPTLEGLRPPPSTGRPAGMIAESGSQSFDPGKSRLVSLLVITFIALFWNGVLSVFIFSGELKPSGGGFFSYLPLLFMVPFLLVGVGLLAGVAYLALGLLNPRLTLVLTPGRPHLGEKSHLAWTLKGSPSRLRVLRLLVIGSEVASYQRGTTTHTDREPFYAQVLAEETSTLAFYQGEVSFQLPYDLMYSLATGHNRIEWEIRVVGEIKPGPDISDTIKIDILPAPSA